MLINLCAGGKGECEVLVDYGIIETLKHILLRSRFKESESSSDGQLPQNTNEIETIQNVFWCFGNIAADTEYCRRALFDDDTEMLLIVESFQKELLTTRLSDIASTDIVFEFTFFLTNLIRKHPMPNL